MTVYATSAHAPTESGVPFFGLQKQVEHLRIGGVSGSVPVDSTWATQIDALLLLLSSSPPPPGAVKARADPMRWADLREMKVYAFCAGAG